MLLDCSVMPLTQKKKSKVKDGKSNVPPKPEEDPISAKPALQENEAESSDVNGELGAMLKVMIALRKQDSGHRWVL